MCSGFAVEDCNNSTPRIGSRYEQLKCCREAQKLLKEKGVRLNGNKPDEIFDYQINLQEVFGTFSINDLKDEDKIVIFISGLEGAAKTIAENYAISDMASTAHFSSWEDGLTEKFFNEMSHLKV